ncbi:hypothetical protein [Empedobacter brevis]|uniref:hypothetical protein n=1 Tax=Empedobacter brevis TaxID=247 RepID=UPI0039AF96AF
MLKINTIAAILLTMISCAVNHNKPIENDLKTVEITRIQSTRKYTESQIIDSKKTYIIHNFDTIVRETRKEDWKKIKELLHPINLSKLENIVVDKSAQTHQFDGAPLVNIVVKENEINYYSPSYDAGSAPKEIYELDVFLKSLSE